MTADQAIDAVVDTVADTPQPTFTAGPDLEFAGTVRHRQPVGAILVTLTLIASPAVLAAAAYIASGPAAMAVTGVAGLLASLVIDHRRGPRGGVSSAGGQDVDRG